MILKPPFEIYHNDIEIADASGHICTAENPEIAKAILDAFISVAELEELATDRIEIKLQLAQRIAELEAENEELRKYVKWFNKLVIRD